MHDADGVGDETMLAFARETKLSETTFVQSATADGADYRNRIWMTTGELPFAGHPSLGTAVAVALARGDDEARYVQETGAGLQPIDVRRTGEALFRASMLQDAATFGAEHGARDALAAAGLDPALAEGGGDLPTQVVSTGTPHLLVPLRAPAEALAQARPDARRLAGLLEQIGATCLYLAALDDAGGHRAHARARSFFLGTGGAVTEDPATGSAAGPLLAHLHARAGVAGLRIDQGVEMGRASRIDCELDDGRPRVAGDVVVLAEGTIGLGAQTDVHR